MISRILQGGSLLVLTDGSDCPLLAGVCYSAAKMRMSSGLRTLP